METTNVLTDITGIFLTAAAIFTVALADAKNQALKTGVSIAGLILGIGWSIAVLSETPSARSLYRILSYTPYRFSRHWHGLSQ